MTYLKVDWSDMGVREGDLIKATHHNGEETVTGRVEHLLRHGRRGVRTKTRVIHFDDHDVEVLDRPLPPISDELVEAAAEEYVKIRGLFGVLDSRFRQSYLDGVTAVINIVREYDRTHNKENA